MNANGPVSSFLTIRYNSFFLRQLVERIDSAWQK